MRHIQKELWNDTRILEGMKLKTCTDFKKKKEKENTIRNEPPLDIMDNKFENSHFQNDPSQLTGSVFSPLFFRNSNGELFQNVHKSYYKSGWILTQWAKGVCTNLLFRSL